MAGVWAGEGGEAAAAFEGSGLFARGAADGLWEGVATARERAVLSGEGL